MVRQLDDPPSVLVVDDVPSARLAVSRILSDWGCTTIQAVSSGAAAMQAFAASAHGFDIVVCDLGMPTDDGLVLLRRLAGLDARPAVILMSGREPQILEAARRLGDHLGLRVLGAAQKPAHKEVLFRLLDAATSPAPGPRSAPSLVLTKSDIVRGLDEQRFELWFQPQYHIRTRRVVAVEALLRLRVDEGLIVGPAGFIGLAEQEGLIDRLTDFAIEAAIAQAAAWQAKGRHMTMAVNLSPASLHDVTLPDRASAACLAQQVDPRRVVFELTESFLASDVTAVLDITTRLRLMGFGLAIDDFGTGYASLAQLDLLPFQQLKIDQSLVQHAAVDPRARTILANTVRLASELKMSVVAEGVETELMFQMAAGLGCDVVQGYLIARPMPARAVEEWLKKHIGHPVLSRDSSSRPDDAASPLVEVRPTAPASAVERFAHDVASPLMLLLIVTESLMNDSNLGRQQTDDIATLNRATTEITSMVEALRRQVQAARPPGWSGGEPTGSMGSAATIAAEPDQQVEERIDVYATWIRELSRGAAPPALTTDDADPLARLGRELQALSLAVARRESELHRLFELAHSVESGVDLDDILDRIFEGFRGVIPYDRIGCAFLSADRTRVTARWARSELGPIRLNTGFEQPMEGSSLQSLLGSFRPRIINDLEAYLAAKPASTATRLMVEEGGRSSLTCPLFVEGSPVGFLFFTSRLKNGYAEEHESAFVQIAALLATVLHKGRVVEQLVRQMKTMPS